MNIVRYTVKPALPESLKPLEELAHNVWLSWNFDAVMLFIRLDYEKWAESRQNPVRLLGMVSQERYKALSEDDSYLAALNAVVEKFRRYNNGDPWYPESQDKRIAYFSMEFGLDVSLPMYSGGLGVLAGDHLKTSSDMGLPLCGVGLLYRQGYFQQYLNADGFQQESYPENDWYNMPVRRCEDKDGRPVKISVQMVDSVVVAEIWEVRVGRVSLFLLSTNVDENSDANKRITATLYGGDREMRIKQEILLGIGGLRALKAMGIEPAVTHMNEGHAAFLGIERIRDLKQDSGLSLDEAIEVVWPTNVFTTHTPVPAGNERFGIDLIQKYFHSICDGTDISWEQFLALGRENPADNEEPFCMTVLALRLSAQSNGVSRLHGAVSRDMWKAIWPGLPIDEVPIGHITNGTHPRSFISHDMLDLLDRYFGPRFYDDPTNLDVWDRMSRISDEELWRTHERRKERLVAFARQRLQRQMEARGAAPAQLMAAQEVLSPYTLTISFARRFATYKRATLLFRDRERLIRLLSDPDRPVQIIFAGKAHPHDIPGKNLIKEIVHFASQPEVRSKIVFLENYDLEIAKYLVSGSDLWLNTPRRPLEASGTSGMKASLNGVLNCSVLDGWFEEGYSPEVGWAIGAGEEYADAETQDEIESKALYDLLEREIIPSYYEQGHDGLPREWIKKMKAAMTATGKQFSAQRMIRQYAEEMYVPAAKHGDRVKKDNFAMARELASYKVALREAWGSVRVHGDWSAARSLKVGDKLEIKATVELGSLQPDQVTVQVYYGGLDSRGNITNGGTVDMTPDKKADGGRTFTTSVTCSDSGRQGFALRVLPKHPGLMHPYLPGFVKWEL